MSKIFDVIIIGGGAAGSCAAYPLVKAGLSVAMLDGGLDNVQVLDNWPATSFEEVRRKDTHQRALFFGPDLESLQGLGSNHSVQMTKGLKSYVTDLAEQFLPLKSNTVSLLQSLARGGLTEAWGGVCDFFDEAELTSVGLPVGEMKRAYQQVCDVIGVSGKSQKLKLQPPVKLDNHGRLLLKVSQQKKSILEKRNLQVYQPPMAVLTKKKNKRSATSYNDLDFWINTGKSVFRPHYLIDELMEAKNFSYIGGVVVQKFREKNKEVEVIVQSILNNSKRVSQKFMAKKIILAAGSVNTTRIILESMGLTNVDVPIIVKPHVIIPCIHLRTLGKAGDIKRLSLCQLVMKYQPRKDEPSVSFSQLYSYKSLLMYKLLANIPLPMPLALKLLTFLTPSFILADTRFTSNAEEVGTMKLIKNKTTKKSYIEVTYPVLSEIQKRHQRSLHHMVGGLRQLGLLPLKQVFMPTGSTAHYAGGVPFVKEEESSRWPVCTTINGQVHQLKHTYIADAATWRSLPAKPPTLTIMANALRVGEEVTQLF